MGKAVRSYLPNVFGIPLIGFIQIVLGTEIIAFLLIKFLTRTKKNKKSEYLINDVHIIVGDDTEKEHQYVYVKNGKIVEFSYQPHHESAWMPVFKDFLHTFLTRREAF